MKINVKVIPNAKRVEIVPGDIWKIKVPVAAVEGRANKFLIELLADYFSVSKSRVKIVTGEKSRNKVVEIIR